MIAMVDHEKTLVNIENVLNALGVHIKNTDGDYRKFDEVLIDLAYIWGKIGTVNQNDIHEKNPNRIVVYGATKERAFEKLQTILDDMRYGDIEQVKKSKDNFIIEFKNGDYYIAISATENARGYKWQYAFVDKLISEEMFNCVVLPSFIPRDKDGNLERNVNIKDRYKWY